MLEVLNLTCVRDERVLFDNLSFTLRAGEMVQIEGENGAGKTSLLRILAGLSTPEQGEVRWQQTPITHQRQQWHRDLLWLGHQPGIKSSLTPQENLAFFHPDCDEAMMWQALDAVELAGYETVNVATLSAGQQRRVALARLWLSKARLWILDEPLTAIDKKGVENLIARMVVHCECGGAVIITTHQDLPAGRLPLRKLRLAGCEVAP